MNRNLLILIIGAVFVAVVMAMLVQVLIGGGDKEEVIIKEEEKVEILLADKDLSIGEKLEPEDMRWQSWPKSATFAGAIIRKDNQKVGDALEGRLARDVSKDEPLTKLVVVGESKGNFVAASLDQGMRAIAINVSASSMVGGFIGPGDYVDLILTYKQTIRTDDDMAQSIVDRNIDKLAAETIIQNVKVLAVDQKATREGDDDAVKVGKTITLALTLEQVEKISLASSMGEINLALRGIGDDEVIEKSWPIISDARLVNVDDEIFTEVQVQKKESGNMPQSMRIYNGEGVQSFSTK